MAGAAIAPTAFLLELAYATLSSLLHTPTSSTALTTVTEALTEIMLPSSCVLPHKPAAAAATELLCVSQPGQLEVRSEQQSKARVHLRARVSKIADAHGSSGLRKGDAAAQSAAMMALTAIVAEGMGCMLAAADISSSSGTTESNTDMERVQSSSNMLSAGATGGLPVSAYPCVSATIDPANSVQYGSTVSSCIQDGGVDGRLMAALEFESALQAGAIARHIQQQKQQQQAASADGTTPGGSSDGTSSEVLSSIGAYLPPACSASAGHDGGHKQLQHVTAALSTSPALPPKPHTALEHDGTPGTAHPSHGIRVSLQASSGPLHKAENVGYSLRSSTASDANAAGLGENAANAPAGIAALTGPHPLLGLDAEARMAHLQVRLR
jgi:hypothetical protein